MRTPLASLLLISTFLMASLAAQVMASPKQTHANNSKALVIAHRGASGYLPEHSLAAKALAYGMGADYIEQDVVMSKDNALLVLHDPYLDRVTNVAEIFPGRAREDGRYYAIDFTLAEIKQLEMTEIFERKDGKPKQKYPERFPVWKSSFKVSTLAEELELIQGLNQSTGKNIGIYPEIKAPALHRAAGKDISLAVLKELKKFGYSKASDKVFLQCFDAHELQRINSKLMPKLGMDLKLVQLIAMTEWGETLRNNAMGLKPEPYNYDWMMKPGAAQKIAEYAEGIGPWFPMLVDRNTGKPNHMVQEAHQAGLLVHPYTFRADKGQVPPQFKNFEEYLAYFYNVVGVDGVFTDFPDRTVKLRDSL
ncbi:glycerophosphodiester phosphodiesterase [uncultured Pseudoteredinibacter sp.]|uniref:glycerophosphodiester phosphodiesterase n=1 Tax=uncultured Pseudoteredinibacter sp. TaxID=1641701 RepID=UPI00261F1249|nr:glycerophosphodiester phosphodiesterase [uncultured Pseudoteredinibacter sp.]